MMSLSFIAVPVLLEATKDAPQLLYAWVRVYHYGHLALPTLSVGTFLMYMYAAFRGNSKRRGVLAAAGLATVAMVPFTWIFMVPTNDELFRLEAASSATGQSLIGFEGVRDLIVAWSKLHVTRSLMPLMGAVLGASEIMAA